MPGVVSLPKLTQDECRVLFALLERLCDENTWINSKWCDSATVHEIAVIHRIVAKFQEVANE